METEQRCLLVVESNKTKRDTLCHHLKQLDYAIAVAESTRQALEILTPSGGAGAPEGRECDLMIVGTGIPERDTCELLSQLNAGPLPAPVPVIVISVANDIECALRCMELKAEDYLLEPLNPTLLKKRIDSCMEKKLLQDQVQKQLRKISRLNRDLHQVILPLGVALSTEKDFDRLLEKILLEAMSICVADSGVLYRRMEKNYLKISLIRRVSLDLTMGEAGINEMSFPPLPLYDEVTGEPNDRKIAAFAALHGESVNVSDVYNDRNFDFSVAMEFDQKTGYRSVSCLTVPMKDHAGEVIGVLQLFNAKDEVTGEVIAFDAYHQLVVESMASLAAVACRNQTLLERQKELSKFERDLQIGHEIQVNFLPRELPQPSGWEIAARFHPARQVAGDFYDGFRLPGDKVGLVIADVCDKGVGPALFMALSRSLIRAFAEQHRPLGWMGNLTDEGAGAAFKGGAQRRRTLLSAGTSALLAVELTNKYIAENHSEMNMFATLFFGVLDPNTGVLTYVNGGHDPPIVVAPDGTVKARLMPTGPAVGMLANMSFDIQKVTLEPGDLLMTFTDGVSDAKNPSGERFGIDRFITLLADQTDPSVPALLDRIEATLRAHIGTADQFDDITMLAVRRSIGNEA